MEKYARGEDGKYERVSEDEARARRRKENNEDETFISDLDSILTRLRNEIIKTQDIPITEEQLAGAGIWMGNTLWIAALAVKYTLEIQKRRE